jgi:hypothetical protein
LTFLLYRLIICDINFISSNNGTDNKSSPLSYFAQKTSLNLVPNWYPIIVTCPVRSDSCSYISNIDDLIVLYYIDCMMFYMLLYYCTLFCIDVFCSWEKKKKIKKNKKNLTAATWQGVV